MSDLVARLRLEAAGGDAAAGQVERVEVALRDAAQAAGGASSQTVQAAAGMSRMGAAADQAEKGIAALAAASQRDFITTYTTAAGQFTAASGRVAGASKLTGAELVNLSRQFSDVGVQAAMGTSALMIMIQQGPQIADVLGLAAARGVSFGAALRDLAAGALRLAPAIGLVGVAVGAVAAPFLLWNKYTSDQKAAIEGLAKANADSAKGLASVTQALGDAAAFADKYKAANDTVSKALDGVLASQSAVYRETLAGLSVTDAAGRAALQLAATRQILTVNTLRQAAAEAQLRAAEQGKAAAAARKPAFWEGALAAIGTGDLAAGQEAQALKFRKLGGEAALEAAKRERALAQTLNETAAALEKATLTLPKAKEAVERRTRAVSDAEKGEKALKTEILGYVETIQEAMAVGARAPEVAKAQAMAAKALAAGYDNAAMAILRYADSLIQAGLTEKGQTVGRVDGLVLTETLGEGLAKQEAELKRLIDDVAFHMEDEFARRGKLAFGDIADFAGEELRRAIYRQILAKPFQIAIDAVIRSLDTSKLGSAVGLAAIGGSLVGGKAGNAVMGGINAYAGTSALATGLGAASKAGALGGLSGLAGSAGTFLAAAAPYVAIIAGLATLIGSLQKPTNAGAGFDLVSGQLSGNKRTTETERAATAAGETILQGQKLLRDAGIQLTTTVNGLVVGTRDLSQIYLSNGATLTSAVGDAAGAADTALKAVLAGATYVSDAQKSLVEGMLAAGQGFDAIATALQGYASAQGIPQQIEDAILAITNPEGSAVAELERAQAEQRAALKAAADAGYLTAAQFATASERLAVLEDLQLEETLKRFADTVSETTEALSAQAGRLTGTVGDRILELTNPAAARVKRINDEIDARIAEAQPLIAAGVLGQDFISLAEQLRALELDALFADLAGQVDTAGKAFSDARPRLLAWMDELKVGARSELSPKAARAEALSQYERTLAMAQGGDRNALGSLTSYADRLLDADRSATSSASARQALRDRVLGQVSGLAGAGAAETTAGAIAALSVPLATLAQAANLDLAAQATGGRAVVVSNLPVMSAMYGQALSGQTDRLVAANDRSREEIVANLKAMADRLDAALAANGELLRASGEAQIQSASASVADVRQALVAMESEFRLMDARARAVA